MANQDLVHGEIVFDSGVNFSGAVVTVRLEDVGLMDAPSQTLAEQKLRNVSYNGAGGIAFRLSGQPPAGQMARYNISAHVSLHGGEDIRQGDYITMESYPVQIENPPDEIQIRVRRV